MFSFVRQDQHSKIFIILNLSDAERQVAFQGTLFEGIYQRMFEGGEETLTSMSTLTLSPWGYRIYLTA